MGPVLGGTYLGDQGCGHVREGNQGCGCIGSPSLWRLLNNSSLIVMILPAMSLSSPSLEEDEGTTYTMYVCGCVHCVYVCLWWLFKNKRSLTILCRDHFALGVPQRSWPHWWEGWSRAGVSESSSESQQLPPPARCYTAQSQLPLAPLGTTYDPSPMGPGAPLTVQSHVLGEGLAEDHFVSILDKVAKASCISLDITWCKALIGHIH